MAPTQALLGAEAEAVLSAAETHRRRRLRRPADRDDFLAARVLARRLLSYLIDGRDPAEWVLTQRCDRCGGQHGRPRLAGFDSVGVSWAHAGGIVAAAASSGPVGVDVEWVLSEQQPPFPQPRAAVSVVPIEAWVGWTRMEAIVKRGDCDLDAALKLPLSGRPAADGLALETFVHDYPRPGVLTDVVGPQEQWVASVAGPEVAKVAALRASLG